MTRRRRRGPPRAEAPSERESDERRVLLMTDYTAFPLWHEGAMIGPDTLPLSHGLVEALRRWADTYDQLPTWGFEWPAQAVLDDFVNEGYRLWRRVQAELGPEWTVEYRNEATGRVEE